MSSREKAKALKPERLPVLLGFVTVESLAAWIMDEAKEPYVEYTEPSPNA